MVLIEIRFHGCALRAGSILRDLWTSALTGRLVGQHAPKPTAFGTSKTTDAELRCYVRRNQFGPVSGDPRILRYALVDLVGFEPTTSSMPFKKYQSLTDSFAQNKRLSKRRRGLRWTPRRLDSTRGVGTWACFPRAVAGCFICRLPKETTIGFHIRMVPTWSGDRLRGFVGANLSIRNIANRLG